MLQRRCPALGRSQHNRAVVMGHPCHRSRQACVVAKASLDGSRDASYEILSAFHYGRALAITLNKRLSEAAIDFISEISKAAAERPQRIKEFQDEVAALARKEMTGSSALPEPASSGGGGASGGGGERAQSVTDPQAAIDELRAEIAYARSALQQIKAAKAAAAAQ